MCVELCMCIVVGGGGRCRRSETLVCGLWCVTSARCTGKRGDVPLVFYVKQP